MSLGIFSTIASIITITLFSLFNRNQKSFSSSLSAIVSSILIASSVILIIIDLSKISLIIFHLIWNICIVIPETFTGTYRLDIVKNKHLVKYNMENNAYAEIILDAGRAVGEILLVIMGIARNHIVDIICLCTIIIISIIYLLHTIKIVKLQKKDSIENI